MAKGRVNLAALVLLMFALLFVVGILLNLPH